jgi:hypothetical protein
MILSEDEYPLAALPDPKPLEYSEEPVMMFSLASPRNDPVEPSI